MTGQCLQDLAPCKQAALQIHSCSCSCSSSGLGAIAEQSVSFKCVTLLCCCACQVDPLDDIDVINLELALADLAQIEKRMDRLKKGEIFTQHITPGCLLVGLATRILGTIHV